MTEPNGPLPSDPDHDDAEIPAGDRRTTTATRLKRLAETIETVRTIVVSGFALALALGAGVFIGVELSRNAVRIESIDSPGSLSEHGYTSAVLGRQLLGAVLRIREGALTTKEKAQLAPGWTETDIEVPGTDLSVWSVIRFVKWYETRISGAITEGKDSALTLRLNAYGTGVNLRDVAVAADSDVDQLIGAGAREVMRATDPFILAAYLYFAEHDRPGACRILRVVLSNDVAKDDAWAHNLWGVILADYGFVDAAVDRFKMAIQLDEGFVQPYSNWARTLISGPTLTAADAALAEDRLETAMELEPELPLAHINRAALRARLLLQRGNTASPSEQDVDPILADLDRAIALDPRSPVGYVTRGKILTAAGRLLEALDAFRHAVDLQATYAPAYYALGEYHTLNESYDEVVAVEMFRRATELDRDFAVAWMTWATLEIEQNPAAALAKLKTATTLDPRLKTTTADEIMTSLDKVVKEAMFLDGQPISRDLDPFGCPRIKTVDSQSG